ncbi:MAG: hypothetical protein PHV38_06085 [Eubacteriales bacterium]|jgi:hypothetical protein|nr:hypothetical protein [Eubacteriales bacterium]NLF47905.1 hypothetical protein [Clostridiales bacterium]
MKGRQVIKVKTDFSKEGLFDFMEQHWAKDQYNSFYVGKPNPLSFEEYIILPATERFMVITYPKKDKIVISVCQTPGGLKNQLITSIPSDGIFFNVYKLSQNMSMEKERKGPAEEVLQKYTEYMRSLLAEAGLL